LVITRQKLSNPDYNFVVERFEALLENTKENGAGAESRL
jgi:hypothetical protein